MVQAMALIKDTPAPTNQRHARVQAAAWVFIYGGLLVLLTGITLATQTDSHERVTAWTLCAAGSLATAVGVALIYIRSRMK